MIVGVAILAFFAAAWGVAALASAQYPWPLYALPIAISLAALISAKRFLPDMPAGIRSDQKRIGRLVMAWSTIEGVGILVAVNVVLYLRRPDLQMAAVCAVVGAHFLPLARGLPQKSYYVTGSFMIALAVGAVVKSEVITPFVVGLGAAVILWATILGFLRRGRVPVAAR